MGLVGNILGITSGIGQQNAATAAAGQDTSAENKLIGQQSGIIDQISQGFFGQGGAQNSLTQLMQSLSGGTINSPYATQAAQTAQGLQNFQGLKPQEIAALQTTLGNAGQSTINTFKSQDGGNANPNALIQNLMNQNQQNSLNLGTQLGGLGAEQELGAQQSAGSIYDSLTGVTLSSLLGATGQETGLLGQGIGANTNLTNLYSNQAQNAATAAQQAGNQINSNVSQLGGGLASLFTGGAGGAGGIGSILSAG